jgi:putative transcriptional regulator
MENKNLKAPSLNSPFSLEGKLLVAIPALNGTCFERAIIFICAQDEEGSLGVIINKQEGMISSDELYKLFSLKKHFRLSRKYEVFFGGPVEDSKFFVLSATTEQRKNFAANKNLTLFTNSEGFLADVIRGKQKNDFLLVKGFCGWAPSQLEEEIKENSWILCEADYQTIFSKKSSKTWNKIIKKLGIKNFDNVVSYTGTA